MCLTGPFIVSPNFFLIVPCFCLTHFLCSDVLFFDVFWPHSFSTWTFTTHSFNFFLSLSWILTYPNIQKLVATSSFSLWQQHKLCGYSGHNLMTGSVSVTPGGGCTICLSMVCPDTFLFLDYHKNHATQFWEGKCKCTSWHSHRFQSQLVVTRSYTWKVALSISPP